MRRPSAITRAVSVAAAILAPAARAEPTLIAPPSAVLREGDPSPGGFPLETLTSILAVERNHSGGWGALVKNRIALSDDFRYEVYGSPTDGAPPELLRRDRTVGDYAQTIISPRFALDPAGEVFYHALADNKATLATDVPTLWREATLIADPFTAVPAMTSRYYTAFADTALDSTGRSVFAATVTNLPTTPATNAMILRDEGAELLFKGGDPIDGLADPSAAAPDVFTERLAVSSDGERWATTARLDTPASVRALVRDAAVVTLAGSPVVQEAPAPADPPMLGQRWGPVTSYDINDDGAVAFSATTLLGQGQQLESFPCLVRGDELLFQSGNQLPGSDTVVTSFGVTLINNQGDTLCLVNAFEPPGFLMFPAVLLNDTLILRPGDDVDFSGDASPDAAFTQVAAVTPADAAVTMSDRDENDVVRIAMIADTSAGRACFLLQVQLDHVFPPCVADLAEPRDGVADFSDVLAFLVYFNDQDPRADLGAPLGVWDFSDVFAFLLAFAEGCPEE